METSSRVPVEVKDAVDARIGMAAIGIRLTPFAELIQVNRCHLCSVLNGHRPMTKLLRVKIERGLQEAVKGEAQQAAAATPPQPNIRRL